MQFSIAPRPLLFFRKSSGPGKVCADFVFVWQRQNPEQPHTHTHANTWQLWPYASGLHPLRHNYNTSDLYSSWTIYWVICVKQPQGCTYVQPWVYIVKQVSIKRFLKRNLAHVGMVQCMNALADKVQKQEVYHAHSDMHSITWPHYSTTIPT